VTALDTAIGRVLTQLDQSGVADNTLVIWYSDNGAFMLKKRGLEVSSNKPLRDGGVTLWEGGIRVPCIIRYPGKIKPGTETDQPFISLDFLPTLVQRAGGKLPTDRQFDGEDIWPMLTGKAPVAERTFYFGYRKFSALRRGRYKLVRSNPRGSFMMFDLQTDLSETTDISEKLPMLKSKLVQAYNNWAHAWQKKE